MSKTNITQELIFQYWINEMLKQKTVYFDTCNELDTTSMGEDAANHYKVSTPNGDSDIESYIFDWAVDFCEDFQTYPNVNKFLSYKMQQTHG